MYLTLGKECDLQTTVTPDLYQRISTLAHQLWEDEGRPNDRAEYHWLQAESMIHAKAEIAKPAKKPATRSKTRKA
jgi:hypothetical protein